MLLFGIQDNSFDLGKTRNFWYEIKNSLRNPGRLDPTVGRGCIRPGKVSYYLNGGSTVAEIDKFVYRTAQSKNGRVACSSSLDRTKVLEVLDVN
jgi:hypothetical protein